MKKTTTTFAIDIPFGWLEVEANPKIIKKIRFLERKPQKTTSRNFQKVNLLQKWCKNYFSGVATLPFPLKYLDLSSATDFEKKVWQKLCEIPFGQTRSYAWVAQEIGKSKAYRAIGQANHKNPFPLIIPCHRVISSTGELGGYAFGPELKKNLLVHEKAEIKQAFVQNNKVAGESGS